MAQPRKATLYIELEHQGVMRPVRFEKVVPTGVRVGSFYLRYRQPGGKRKWENVGTERNVALREQKARQASVRNAATLVPTAIRSTLTSATATYLSTGGRKMAAPEPSTIKTLEAAAYHFRLIEFSRNRHWDGFRPQ